MERPERPRIDPGVFWISLAITVAFVLWGVLATESVATVTGAILDYVIGSFGWVFILASFGFLAFSVYLAVSRFGSVKLGADDEEPEFRTV
jgi:glycine betaine transporter